MFDQEAAVVAVRSSSPNPARCQGVKTLIAVSDGLVNVVSSSSAPKIKDVQRVSFEFGMRVGLDWAETATRTDLETWSERVLLLAQQKDVIWNDVELPEGAWDVVTACRYGYDGEAFDAGDFARGFLRGVEIFCLVPDRIVISDSRSSNRCASGVRL